MTYKHVVMFSGGVGSWATAKRVAEQYGTHDMILLFADTRVEEPDLYRFLEEAADNVGAPLIRVADGRTPFEVFQDERFLGNDRLAPCSKYLKQKPCREWLEENCSPARSRVYVGIDWTEIHRLPAIEEGWKPYLAEAPMTRPPYLDKDAMLDWLRREGVRQPKAYDDGMPHSNCLAQGCVRGGKAYWRHLLKTRPEVYAETEREEQAMRDYLGADVSILRDRRGGKARPFTLREFREELQGADELGPDVGTWGGCGCFTDAPE